MAATPARWVGLVAENLDAVLADHAHCELKAASTALSIVGRFGDRPSLVTDMTALAREEMKHFDQVHRLVRARGGALPAVASDRYARALKQQGLKRLPGSSALMDLLVLCAFIEARSCERFRLLAKGPLDATLRGFYADLADAEGRHHDLFLERAVAEAGEEVARARVKEVAELEARIVRSLPLEARIH
jgi:tRNA-(ms[2]io[6]A)-hydroxylase